MTHRFRTLKSSGTRHDIGLQVGTELRDVIPRVVDQIFDYELALCERWTSGTDAPRSHPPLRGWNVGGAQVVE